MDTFLNLELKMFKLLKKIFGIKKTIDDYQRPKVVSFKFDNEKITAHYDILEPLNIFYKQLTSIYIIFLDFDYPVPLWTFVSDDYSIQIPNDYPTDIQRLIDILSNHLEDFDEHSHQEIIKAMGATIGLFHIWIKDNK